MNRDEQFRFDLNAAGKEAQQWAREAGWREPHEGEHLQDYLRALREMHKAERESVKQAR